MSASRVELPELEGVSHRQVDVGGLSLHVAEAGSGSPVLALHGWPQHWWCWRGVIPGLAEHHRVICPDLRGFGWSDAPPGLYAKETLGRDVLALMDALELDRVDLLAHDWGAWIGFIICIEQPQRFDHYLALNIPTPWPEPPSLRGLGVLARLWYQVALATPWLGETLIRRTDFVRRLIAAGAVHPQSWSEWDLDLFADVLREPARARASSALYRTFLTRELGPFLRGRYDGRRLSVPTLLLHGTRDLAIDQRSLGNWRAHADAMELELTDDSGHFIAEELPELVLTRALELFAGTRVPGAAVGATP